MSPSTKPGAWTCLICKPNVHDKGGQREFYAHFNRLHLATKDAS